MLYMYPSFQGATALFDMIEYYESCIRLNISYNKTIGVRGWQSCARMMKKVRLQTTILVILPNHQTTS